MGKKSNQESSPRRSPSKAEAGRKARKKCGRRNGDRRIKRLMQLTRRATYRGSVAAGVSPAIGLSFAADTPKAFASGRAASTGGLRIAECGSGEGTRRCGSRTRFAPNAFGATTGKKSEIGCPKGVDETELVPPIKGFDPECFRGRHRTIMHLANLRHLALRLGDENT